MATYIYSRVSTQGQTTENQLFDLRNRYPEAEWVSETISGTKDKPILTTLLARLSHGDVLVIAALDRLGRRASRAITLIESLYERGITVVSIREGVDYSTSAGRMIANVMFSMAQLERDLISERTKASLQRLKSQGVKLGRKKGAPIKNTKPLGRPRNINSSSIQAVLDYRKQGLTIKEINKLTNISTGRICQLLKA